MAFSSVPILRRSVLRAGVWSGLAIGSGAWLAAPVALAAAPADTSGVMLAKPWLASLNPADYLVSEKLDGVRALWDGKSLRFRSGRPIAAPAWFLAALPGVALDGELWMGRRSFEVLSGEVRKAAAVDAAWRRVLYKVFDAPTEPGPFAQRAAYLANLLPQSGAPWLQAVEQRSVTNAAALQSLLQETLAAGGEGLVLHRADALWMPGRSDAVRKLKAEPDEEGRVVGHLPGKGKHQCRMGALLLETPEGKRFALGTGFSDAQRADPPPVGSVVTYRYRDRTANGVPKFASFVRVREAE